MSKLHNEQFKNNFGIMSEGDYLKIQQAKLLVIGLGGLGGHLVNNLVRLGVTHLKIVDFDVFDMSNINRQLFSSKRTIGKSKVEVIKSELQKINPSCHIDTVISKVEELPLEECMGYDYIIDTVDTPQTKVYLAALSRKLHVPLLHGACGGWYGQVGWIEPGCTLIEDTYKEETQGIEKELLNPSFTPSAVSAIMTAEFVKYIQKDDNAAVNQFLLIDLLNNSFIKTGEQ